MTLRESLLNGKFNKNLLMILFSLLALSFLPSCAKVESKSIEKIEIDGSSTVFPVTQLMMEKYKQQSGSSIEVEFTGTVQGFKEFCQGKTDINNASIPIPKSAMEKCKQNGVAYIELPIGFDPLTIVVNKNNDSVEQITLEELKNIWDESAENQITHWNQVNSDWQAKSLNLFGPGKESGTYKYFTTVVLGDEGVTRQDYAYNQDDQAIANAVSQDDNALGYFGHSYYQKNKDSLKALRVVNSAGIDVDPSTANAQNGSYNPFSRPLFIYVNAEKAQNNRNLQHFVKYYLQEANQVVREVGYVSLPNSAYQQALINFETSQIGTAFNGSPVTDLTFQELLAQTYAQNGQPGYTY